MESAHGIKTAVIKADATNVEECGRCVRDTISALGSIDGVISNAGWTRFSDFGDLHSMSDEEWNRCWNAQVMGPKRIIMEAYPHFQKNKEGGFVIITSSIAAQKIAGSSMPYSVTKAAQVHFMKCVAQTHGPVLRINAVLPGLMLTEWGNKYDEDKVQGMRDAAALKKEVSSIYCPVVQRENADNRLQTEIDECADMYVALATNTSVTGQAFTVDSGLNVGNM